MYFYKVKEKTGITNTNGMHRLQEYLTNGDNKGRKQKHSYSHPGDIRFQPPRLSKIPPALKHPWRDLCPGENKHL